MYLKHTFYLLLTKKTPGLMNKALLNQLNLVINLSSTGIEKMLFLELYLDKM